MDVTDTHAVLGSSPAGRLPVINTADREEEIGYRELACDRVTACTARAAFRCGLFSAAARNALLQRLASPLLVEEAAAPEKEPGFFSVPPPGEELAPLSEKKPGSFSYAPAPLGQPVPSDPPLPPPAVETVEEPVPVTNLGTLLDSLA